jgi:hypothetical protein
MNSAAVIDSSGQRLWQRSGMITGSAWVLVGAPQDPLERPALVRTSYQERRRHAQAQRRFRAAERPGWLWLIRWYRARWSAHRAIRLR